MSRNAFTPDSSVVAEVLPSPNNGERRDGRRPDMILLHYTGMADAEAALELLRARGSDVSCHYFVFEDGRIVQMVPEGRRAWHAGQSCWAAETDINSCSIGIEIANSGHDHGYPDFPKRQIAAVTALCRSIQIRHTIPPVRVLAHSDVAPSRKQDPGEKFPWRTLYDSGVGHWVKPAPIVNFGHVLSPGNRGETVAAFQRLLVDYGYGVEVTGEYDAVTGEVVTAFQRHFRPDLIDGIADASTRSTLADLIANRGRTRTIAARTRNPMLQTTF
ncbi:MAG TPA: N-acetylmuramoyl-L-alanine amidase [Xanthobacteraceae bacterium]|jgi:N-acetylmuramoyl-L-alanine amidase